MLRLVIEHKNCYFCDHYKRICFVPGITACEDLQELYLLPGKLIEGEYSYVIAIKDSKIKVEAMIALFRMKYPLCVFRIQLVESKKYDKPIGGK